MFLKMSGIQREAELDETRLAIENLHKNTKDKFSEVISDLTVEYSNEQSPLISDEYYAIVIENAARLDEKIDHKRDFDFDLLSIRKLEQSYLLRINGKIVERPQHMIMRVAVGIHGEDIDAAIETYELMSQRYFIHSSTTLVSAAMKKSQFCSAYSLPISDDSIYGIYDTLKHCATISKSGACIGLNVSCVRAKGSVIVGINGISNGLVPMLRIFNDTAKFVNQGRIKRPGALAVYLEPWHAEIFEFLDLKKETGKSEYRAQHLFYGLWIPDLFMKRVKENGDWSLMCPNKCPGLIHSWGEEFEKLYMRYEKEDNVVRTVKAQDVWFAIVASQIDTGMPYMMYKDTCNRKSNQKNLGTIQCSSFSTECIQYSSQDEMASCCLASIALNKFVTSDKKYDFEKLREITRVVARNLNKIIDINYYPRPESSRSNFRHRPIGIGVQGLADAFILMRYPYESEEAKLLNQQIFETIYYAALEASCELAKEQGVYDSYKGSPISQGIFQFDIWGKTPTSLWNWEHLKANVMENGIRNSLLIALMPAESTSQILGNTNSFEPLASNVFNLHFPTNQHRLFNPYLIKDLKQLNLWNDEMKKSIVQANGSIQNITMIPKAIRDLYKTVWEISIRKTIQMAADRGAFVDQSQSFNIYLPGMDTAKLTAIHFHEWEMGLKTGMHLCRPDTRNLHIFENNLSSGES